jgi:hypothetical protein
MIIVTSLGAGFKRRYARQLDMLPAGLVDSSKPQIFAKELWAIVAGDHEFLWADSATVPSRGRSGNDLCVFLDAWYARFAAHKFIIGGRRKGDETGNAEPEETIIKLVPILGHQAS